MAVGDKLVSADGVKAVYNYTQTQVDAVKNALVEIPHSNNWLNPDDSQFSTGKDIVQTGTSKGQLTDDSTKCVTGPIPAAYGDTIYFNGIKLSNGALLNALATRIATYDANGTCLDVTTWPAQGFTVSYETAAYIRVVYNAAYQADSGNANACSRVAVLHSAPSSASDVDAYKPVTYEAADETARDSIEDIEGDISDIETDIAGTKAKIRPVVTDKYISCWGDSFIANGHGDSPKTSVCAYLAGLMGSGYFQSNNGFSGQGSGEIALKMGAIDVYVNLENGQIVDGDNTITRVHMRRGSVNQNLMQSNGTAANGVSCIINGVNGYFWSYDSSDEGTDPEPHFTPSGTVSSPVSVAPLTKIHVGASMHQYRFVVIWCGKNDFLHYGGSSFQEYLADTVSAMAESIPHNRFVILGVTTSLTDAYATGGAARTVMDKYNNLMKRRFPDNFIDIQAELMTPVTSDTYKVKGLELAEIQFGTDAGLTPHHDMTDAEALAAGLLLPSLLSNGTLNSAVDVVHPNAGCRLAVAKIIYAHAQAKGWV